MKWENPWLLKASDVIAVSVPASIVLNLLLNQEVPIVKAIGGGLLTFVLVLNIVAMVRRWRRSPKIWFVSSDDGSAVDYLVKRARDTIRMTHATGIVPHVAYQNLLVEKTGKKVTVERYVQRDATHAQELFQWLANFNGCNKHYKQFEVPDRCPLPLDIMTFDDDTVVIHLPRKDTGDDFFSAIIIKDEKIKEFFDNVFVRLRKRCEAGSGAGK